MHTPLVATLLFVSGSMFAQTPPALAKSADAAQRIFDQVSRQQPDTAVFNLADVDVAPVYPGGEQAMYAFLQQELEYPDEGGDGALSGKVYVAFIVDRDGRVTQVRSAKGAHPTLDAEAERAVRAMPPWQPGMRKGAAVRTRMVLPVHFARD